MRHSRLYDIFTLFLFVAFLLSPICTLAVFGIPEPYGQKAYSRLGPSDPIRLFGSDLKPRNDYVRAVIERSPIRKSAIKAWNTFNYDAIGYVDNAEIVSGLNGWLFYKEQFWGGKCLEQEKIVRVFRKLATLRALAAAAGQRLEFSVSPDKSTIYPEMLGSRATRLYAACKAASGDLWRRLAKEHAPFLIDHTVELLARKSRPDGTDGIAPLYYPTDTHWTRFVAPLVSERLLKSIFPQLTPRELATVDYQTTSKMTDLRDQMLLLERGDQEPLVVYKTAVLSSEQSDIVIIHDSFYQGIIPHLSAVFPGASFHHIRNDVSGMEMRLREKKSTILVNIVERSLFKDPTRSGGKLAELIIERNMEEARACKFLERDPEQRKSVKNATRDGSHYIAMNKDPQISIVQPSGGPTCLRVDLEVPVAGTFEIFLAPLTGLPFDRSIEAGRSMAKKLSAGRHDLRFILPSVAKKAVVRVDPIDQPVSFEVRDLSFGSLPSPHHNPAIGR